MTLLSTAGFPPTAGPLVTTTLLTDHLHSVTLRSSGKTIGTAGGLFFGVGPAPTQTDLPFGLHVNDYFPSHAATGSVM